ncbi:hypothetical protein EF888_07305 [Silicimonas algicola]|uniref:Uncharacterized protein n=1 Tax=Silicimonas algicola TaxID=1826607 RepID=A0A316G4C1_9RHOB|nr:hypothetical protein [Silicimonas algicola]AZQ66959.1 hypothetical protein EF888_07305 [Silicimonas algicola]PWK55533.1 hypothetical protein C8D95_107199 [Silicimonas algicola]
MMEIVQTRRGFFVAFVVGEQCQINGPMYAQEALSAAATQCARAGQHLSMVTHSDARHLQ